MAAPYYNGDAVTMIDENPDLAFYVPKEGTNLFVDAMCIPKNAKNVSGAGEVHQLRVLDRGGDGKLGVCRLFQPADRGL